MVSGQPGEEVRLAVACQGGSYQALFGVVRNAAGREQRGRMCDAALGKDVEHGNGDPLVSRHGPAFRPADLAAFRPADGPAFFMRITPARDA